VFCPENGFFCAALCLRRYSCTELLSTKLERNYSKGDYGLWLACAFLSTELTASCAVLKGWSRGWNCFIGENIFS
jgi:hypothetical protein